MVFRPTFDESEKLNVNLSGFKSAGLKVRIV